MKNYLNYQGLTKFLALISSKFDAKLDTKVDKVDGKQLSTEDFSTEEKVKLSGIESGAQVNKIETVSNEFKLENKNLSIDSVDVSKLTQVEDLIIDCGDSKC